MLLVLREKKKTREMDSVYELLKYFIELMSDNKRKIYNNNKEMTTGPNTAFKTL